MSDPSGADLTTAFLLLLLLLLLPLLLLLQPLSRSSKNSHVSMILASLPTYRTSSERGQRRASSGDNNDDDKYAHKYTQIQRQTQERKGLSAEKAIDVAYFRNSESARISNMILSVHHQTITQRQIQRQRQRQRQSVEKTIHVAYF